MVFGEEGGDEFAYGGLFGWVGVGGWGHEGEFLALVEDFGEDAFDGFAQDVLFDVALDAEAGGDIDGGSGEFVIEEGGAGFHGVGHVHAVTAPVEDLAFELAFGPGVLRDVEGVAAIEHGFVEAVGDFGDGIVVGEFAGDVVI